MLSAFFDRLRVGIRRLIRAPVYTLTCVATLGPGIGATIAILVAFGATRLMISLLFGVSAADPLTFLAVAVLLTAMVLVACYLPARRAARTDPVQALHGD